MSIKEITIDELKVALSSGSQLIDVREADEFEAGHIPSAVLVSLGTVPENIDLFRSDTNVFLVCHSGGRSMRAYEFLHEQGITKCCQCHRWHCWLDCIGQSVVNRHSALNPAEPTKL